jgi:hypothetical protein
MAVRAKQGHCCSIWCQLPAVASKYESVIYNSSSCRERAQVQRCLPFRCTTHVQVYCADECAVAPVSERCHHQAAAVAQVLVPVLGLQFQQHSICSPSLCFQANH